MCWVLILPLLLAGCYPDEAEFSDQMELVATECDVNYTFGSIQTYIMPDTVMPITDPDHPDNNKPINNTLNKLILNKVEEHFNELGYQRLNNTDHGVPDVYVTLSAIAASYILNNGDYWWYFWDYYPWWPGWGEGYYPWYPWGKPVYYGYKTGTLIIQMMDVTGTDEKQIPVVWSATLNGLLGGGDQLTDQRVERDIDQAFKQASYLKN